MQQFSGGCLCGAVRFADVGPPTRVGICHCQDCRRTSGPAFSFFGIWDRASYQGQGELATFNGRSFCPACGSPVVHLRDAEAEIMVGSLDEAQPNSRPTIKFGRLAASAG
jgi:hypothetical protein